MLTCNDKFSIKNLIFDQLDIESINPSYLIKNLYNFFIITKTFIPINIIPKYVISYAHVIKHHRAFLPSDTPEPRMPPPSS